MSDLVEKSFYDEASDSLHVNTSYDNRDVIAENQFLRNTAPETGRYKGNLVKAATIHLGDIVRLKNLGYNLLSPDPEEVKRAILYIQSEEKSHLLMPGTPFSKKRQVWA
jgi:hypothetical protein